MQYDIKAIPTTYSGVRFRSRLEARWAAFFDLARVKWQYEPFDLDGWAPDFLIAIKPFPKTDDRAVNILVEVKPVDPDADYSSVYDKAVQYWSRYHILLCGLGPNRMNNFGFLCDLPLHDDDEFSLFNEAQYTWDDVNIRLFRCDAHDLWREAGNLVQWNSAR
jgi:hypothetical protein